jgi:uncharacterized CHY-type Zn-finger protein
VYIQATCCGSWFDCAECHDEKHSDHQFESSKTLRLMCKTCNRVFQKDLGLFAESDKHCEGCNIKWCIPGITPESVIYHESRNDIHNVLEGILKDAEKK